MLHPRRVIPPGVELLTKATRLGGLGHGAAEDVVVVAEYGRDLDLAANGLRRYSSVSVRGNSLHRTAPAVHRVDPARVAVRPFPGRPS